MAKSRTNISDSEEKILTKHPQGKRGVNISKSKYERVKKEILSLLRKAEPTHTELFKLLNDKLQDRFDGNISWYGETIKLDLEARGIIQRTSSKPARYQLAEKVKLLKR
ncbi:conserved hypothetical protein [Candidatus Zixiibacteriota bacterium]|nr:conserved hypothetical protein [candidate division Zixibacteria bacterium]